MGKKLKVAMIILCSLLVVLLTTAIYLYRDSENRYIIQVALRSIELSRAHTELKTKKTCFNSETKPECFNTLIGSLNGIEGSPDFTIYLVFAFKICDGVKKNPSCFYSLGDVLVKQIDPENFWLSKNISHADIKFKELFNLEMNHMDRFLRNYRKKLVELYDTELDPIIKLKALEFIKSVDSKIVQIQLAVKK